MIFLSCLLFQVGISFFKNGISSFCQYNSESIKTPSRSKMMVVIIEVITSLRDINVLNCCFALKHISVKPLPNIFIESTEFFKNMVELIITEKPSSAKKVAEALAEGKLDQKRSKQSSYYELTHGGKKIIVTSAVGHLYGLVEDKRNGWNYPVFDIRWESSDKSSKDLKYVKDYIDTITSLAKKCDEFTVATDYDVEGEVIGLNVVRYTCSQKDANRMKFSTLTKGDLIEAYDQKMHHLDWGQAFAGETRHKLDWFYGINLSRALTASVKAAGSFKVMSAGRVQGPALKLLVDREKE